MFLNVLSHLMKSKRFMRYFKSGYWNISKYFSVHLWSQRISLVPNLVVNYPNYG